MNKRDRSIANMRSEAQKIYYQRQEIKRLQEENQELKERIFVIKNQHKNYVEYLENFIERLISNNYVEEPILVEIIRARFKKMVDSNNE